MGGANAQDNQPSGEDTTPMLPHENLVRDAIENGKQNVYYSVTPRYLGDRTVPIRFDLVALGSNARGGQPAISFAVPIPNVLAGLNLGTFSDPDTGDSVPIGATP